MSKPKKTEVIRVRVEPSWKYEIEALARLKKLDVADIIRISCDEFKARHTQPFTPQAHAA